MIDKKEVKHRSRYEETRNSLDAAWQLGADFAKQTAIEEAALSLAVIADILKWRMK